MELSNTSMISDELSVAAVDVVTAAPPIVSVVFALVPAVASLIVLALSSVVSDCCDVTKLFVSAVESDETLIAEDVSEDPETAVLPETSDAASVDVLTEAIFVLEETLAVITAPSVTLVESDCVAIGDVSALLLRPASVAIVFCTDGSALLLLSARVD